MGYRLKFDAEKCVGCLACNTACLDAHYADMDELESRRTSRKVIRNNFEKNICPGCIHCGRCMEACLSGALFRDDETGFVLADTDKCTGCRKCQTMCPVGVIHYSKEGRIRKCDGCIDRIREGREPACVRVCCVHAISFEEI